MDKKAIEGHDVKCSGPFTILDLFIVFGIWFYNKKVKREVHMCSR